MQPILLCHPSGAEPIVGTGYEFKCRHSYRENQNKLILDTANLLGEYEFAPESNVDLSKLKVTIAPKTRIKLDIELGIGLSQESKFSSITLENQDEEAKVLRLYIDEGCLSWRGLKEEKDQSIDSIDELSQKIALEDKSEPYVASDILEKLPDISSDIARKNRKKTLLLEHSREEIAEQRQEELSGRVKVVGEENQAGVAEILAPNRILAVRSSVSSTAVSCPVRISAQVSVLGSSADENNLDRKGCKRPATRGRLPSPPVTPGSDKSTIIVDEEDTDRSITPPIELPALQSKKNNHGLHPDKKSQSRLFDPGFFENAARRLNDPEYYRKDRS